MMISSQVLDFDVHVSNDQTNWFSIIVSRFADLILSLFYDLLHS